MVFVHSLTTPPLLFLVYISAHTLPQSLSAACSPTFWPSIYEAYRDVTLRPDSYLPNRSALQ